MHENILASLHKCINGSVLTETERQELENWAKQSVHNQKLYDEIVHSDSFRDEIKDMLNYEGKSMWKKVARGLQSEKQKNASSVFRNRFFRYAAAAALFILISTIAYFLFVKPTTLKQEPVSGTQPAVVAPDLPPGTEKAVLTLDNGTDLVLDHASNGKIAEQGNTIIVKEDGLLAYNSGKESNGNIYYNTLTTPRAGYYSSLVLADGSKVWLNALSSIRFPTAFTGTERVVEVTGEVYLEVARNVAKPFKVNVKDKGVAIEVLGTHFNVNGYNDEKAVKTTLLEGAVKITADGKAGFLKPGQQAQVSGSGLVVVNGADLEKVMAWKNGTFLFKKENLETIMREVSRWYGVEVIFKDKVPGQFVATLPRNVPVSKLLKIFEMAGGVHFDIDDTKKTITVRL